MSEPVLIDRGNKRVMIQDNDYGTTLFVMMNGFQWWGYSVDDEMLEMIRDAIGRYFVEVEQDFIDQEKGASDTLL